MVTKDKDKLEEAIRKYPLPEGIEFVEILNCNFKPHPYTIGPKHVAYASDNCNGMLGEETVKNVPCAFTWREAGRIQHCQTAYEDHTYNSIALFKFVGMAHQEEFKNYVIPMFEKEDLEAKGVDGLNFIEPGEGKGFYETK